MIDFEAIAGRHLPPPKSLPTYRNVRKQFQIVYTFNALLKISLGIGKLFLPCLVNVDDMDLNCIKNRIFYIILHFTLILLLTCFPNPPRKMIIMNDLPAVLCKTVLLLLVDSLTPLNASEWATNVTWDWMIPFPTRTVFISGSKSFSQLLFWIATLTTKRIFRAAASVARLWHGRGNCMRHPSSSSFTAVVGDPSSLDLFFSPTVGRISRFSTLA